MLGQCIMKVAPVRADVRVPVVPLGRVTRTALIAVALLMCGQALTDLDMPTHAVVWGALALASYAGTLSAVTPIGDLYRHGGWVPVIVEMFLLGCGVRLLNDVRGNPHAILLVLLLFPSLVKAKDDWVTLAARIPGTVMIWPLAVALTFCARRTA
jgi:threonine/homoserine/homoserine lactone efflux protein